MVDSSPCSVYMYDGQFWIQRLLLFIGVVCVPWMLLARPYILHRENKQRATIGNTGLESGMEDAVGGEGGEGSCTVCVVTYTNLT